MKLDDCLDQAIAAGTVTRERAEAAKARFRDLVQRYEDSGNPRPIAEVMAADEAVESIVREAKSRRHATLTALAVMQRNEARYAGAHVADPDRVLRDIERADLERQGLERSFFAGTREFLERHRTNVLGVVRQRAALMDVVREMHGQATGNASAKAMADAVSAQMERARRLFNAAGGDIGYLEGRGLRHRHNADKIERAGFAAWFDDLWSQNRIAWDRIVDHTTGKPFSATPGARPNRARAEAFLRNVYDGIVTGGWDDRFPSLGGGHRATGNTRAAHRVLHFRDGDAWIAYNEKFGTENPFEAIVGELRGMARDIALMRIFGPNPRAGLEHVLQVLEKGLATDASLTGDARIAVRRTIEAKAGRARAMMRVYTGEANVPTSTFWAHFFAGTRNLLTAAQLGSAVLSQVTDWASSSLAARAIGTGAGKTVTQMMRQIVGGMSRQQARDLGFIFDTWFDAGSTMGRFMGDVWAPEWTSRLSNFVMRATGQSFLTDRMRVGVAAALGSDLADMAGRAFGDLPGVMQAMMTDLQVGPREWDAVRAVLYTDAGGGRHVNGDWFRVNTALPEAEAEDIAIRWGAFVRAFTERAIPTASLRGRTMLGGATAPGTFMGELGRSAGMYKSFAMSQLFGQIRQAQEFRQASRSPWPHVAFYVGAMTLAGALAVHLKDVAKGRDPRPMDSAEFWWAAMLQGGGIGIFGDFFTSTVSRAGGGIAETLAGPVAGLAGDVGRAFTSNVARAAEGKSILLGRDVVNLARRYNPFATFQPPVPIPTRLAMDRLLWDQLQAILDPEAGDLWRQEAGRLKRETDQQLWWQRGESLPRRGPDFSTAVGGAP